MNGLGQTPCVVGALDANGNTIAYCPPTGVDAATAAALQMASDAAAAAQLAAAMPTPAPQPNYTSLLYAGLAIGILFVVASMVRR